MIAEGKYDVAPVAATVTESDAGNFMVVLTFELEGVRLNYYAVICKADGTVNIKTIDRLRACFPAWDDGNPFWFMRTDLTGYPVRVTVKHEPGLYDQSQMFAKISWINPINGNGQAADSPVVDERAFMARFGGQLRAVAGGTPVKPATQAPATPPAAKVGAWEMLNKLMTGKPANEIEAAWFAIIDQHGGNVADITDWDNVIATIVAEHDSIPF